MPETGKTPPVCGTGMFCVPRGTAPDPPAAAQSQIFSENFSQFREDGV